MSVPKLLIAATAAIVALAACEARFGNAAGPDGNGSAEGKAENGELTVHAQGMDLKINLPARLRREAGMSGNSDIIYPGSTMNGVHVEAGTDDSGGHSHGGVEFTFTSADAPDPVARWYRDPARAPHFTIATANRDGPAIVMAGATHDGDDDVRIRLSPRDGGGTDARVVVSNRH